MLVSFLSSFYFNFSFSVLLFIIYNPQILTICKIFLTFHDLKKMTDKEWTNSMLNRNCCLNPASTIILHKCGMSSISVIEWVKFLVIFLQSWTFGSFLSRERNIYLIWTTSFSTPINLFNLYLSKISNCPNGHLLDSKTSKNHFPSQFLSKTSIAEGMDSHNLSNKI